MVHDKVVDYLRAGRRIKLARIEREWSQEDLAEKADVSTTFISNIENAHTKASLATFIKLANALELGLDDLVCDSIKQGHEALNNQLITLTKSCSDYEMRVIVETVRGLIGALSDAEEYIRRIDSN